MDKIKAILTVIAVIIGALAVLAAVGFIYSLLGYLLIFGVLCLGGYLAFKLLGKSDERYLSSPDPKKELEKVQRLLDESKHK